MIKHKGEIYYFFNEAIKKEYEDYLKNGLKLTKTMDNLKNYHAIYRFNDAKLLVDTGDGYFLLDQLDGEEYNKMEDMQKYIDLIK